MRVVPVIDVLGGTVVHAVAGRRHEYRPIVSGLTTSCDPEAVARVFRDRFDLHELYLADLDALDGAPPNLRLYYRLAEMGFEVWVDAGTRAASQAAQLHRAGVAVVVVGLETLTDWTGLEETVEKLSSQHVAFSLDLKNGRPLGRLASVATTAEQTAEQAYQAGARRMIVLDLAHVGTGTGTGTEALCRWLRSRFENLELIAGGGIRQRSDLERLHAIGVDAALVASALHSGRITAADLTQLARHS